MRIVMFYHSLISDWNHGNAHFLRGIATELISRGHKVQIYEDKEAWSAVNLVADHGPSAFDGFAAAYPGLTSIRYDPDDLDIDAALRDADLVLVHEWNRFELIFRIGAYRNRHPHFCLLFHDTHHRAVTAPEEIGQFALSSYDGVLAFGEAVAAAYRKHGWHDRVWCWHEAADTRVFKSGGRIDQDKDAFAGDLVWIGNWGDDERTGEIQEFLIDPVRELQLKARVYGVRYPKHALQTLERMDIEYCGWLPNYRVPEVFSQFRTTVHIPRRPYVNSLPGVPTIRVFEALACGIPLLTSFWPDAENLFAPGQDYLVARNGAEMKRHIATLLADPAFAAAIAAHGQRTVLARHTCAHRVEELLAIYAEASRIQREVNA